MTTPENSRRVDADRAAPDEHVYPAAVPATAHRSSRQELIAREKGRFGGMRFGTAFFGWLAAVGTTVVLVAIVAAVSAAISAANGVDPATALPSRDPLASINGAASLTGAVSLLLVVFIAYVCGGYVAGRMARFSGAKQGIAVWLWSLVVTVVGSVIGLAIGGGVDLPALLDGAPQLDFLSGDLALGGVIAALVVAVVSLGGAVLGGIAGMRYHRRVDRIRAL